MCNVLNMRTGRRQIAQSHMYKHTQTHTHLRVLLFERVLGPAAGAGAPNVDPSPGCAKVGAGVVSPPPPKRPGLAGAGDAGCSASFR